MDLESQDDIVRNKYLSKAHCSTIKLPRLAMHASSVLQHVQVTGHPIAPELDCCGFSPYVKYVQL